MSTLLETDIRHLKGCGKKTTERLNVLGVFSYGDLLKKKIPVSDTLLLKLQTTVSGLVSPKVSTPSRNSFSPGTTAHSSNPLVISDHNWQGRICHILRRGVLVRVQIGDLILQPYQMTFQVTWKNHKLTHRRHVNPFVLLFIQYDWLMNEYDSDTSNSDSHTSLMSLLPKFNIASRTVSEQDKIEPHISSATGRLIKQLEELYDHLYPEP